MISFLYVNSNPYGKKTGDCVIRAISLALGKNYFDVYAELFELSVNTGYMINDKRTEEKYIAKNGFIKHKQPKKLSGKKYTVGEIDKLCKDKVILISCAHHLTVVIDGAVNDIWDCRGKCISNYYTLQ